MEHKEQKNADQEFDLKVYLEDCFQALQSDQPAPEVLKKEVFDTLDTIQFMADVTDLFTVKFTKSESQLIDLVDSASTSKNEPGPDVDNPKPPPANLPNNPPDSKDKT